MGNKTIVGLAAILVLMSNVAAASVIGAWSQENDNLILDLQGSIDSSGLTYTNNNYTSDYIGHRHNGYSQIIASENALSSNWSYFSMTGDWSLIDSSDTSLNLSIFDNHSYSGATSVAFMMGFDATSGNGYFGADSRFTNGVSTYDQQVQFNGFFATQPTLSLALFNDFTLTRVDNTFSLSGSNVVDVPEPSTLMIIALGLIGLGARRLKA